MITNIYRRTTLAIGKYSFGSLFSLAVFLLPFVTSGQPLESQTLSVIHSFKGAPDGCKPQGNLYRDGAGTLYGTAANCGASGNGIVFKVTAAGKETILHTFTGTDDGGLPGAGLIRDSSGNFYGTAYSGGASKDGIVFKLMGSVLIALYSFSGADGAHPAASLIRDSAGNLYGTTFYGGTASCACGTIFKIDSSGNESVLYSFTGGADGKFPAGRLLRDSLGNLYGTTSDGATVNCGRFNQHGCGTIFKLDTTNHLSALWTFTGGTDGGKPQAGLIRDSSGNLYGTAFSGGNVGKPCALNNGCGVVFELNKSNQLIVLHTFATGTDGANPTGDLVRDSAGNLFGTTKLGGGGATVGFGIVFEIPSGGGESILHTFTGNGDGADPLAGLILDANGNLYGTASAGGSATKGVVFQFTP